MGRYCASQSQTVRAIAADHDGGTRAWARRVLRVALSALKLRDVTQINRVLEWPICFMTDLALHLCQAAQVDRMLERPSLRILFRRIRRVVNHCVAEVAIVPDYFAGLAHMLVIMTTETTCEIEMAY